MSFLSKTQLRKCFLQQIWGKSKQRGSRLARRPHRADGIPAPATTPRRNDRDSWLLYQAHFPVLAPMLLPSSECCLMRRACPECRMASPLPPTLCCSSGVVVEHTLSRTLVAKQKCNHKPPAISDWSQFCEILKSYFWNWWSQVMNFVCLINSDIYADWDIYADPWTKNQQWLMAQFYIAWFCKLKWKIEGYYKGIGGVSCLLLDSYYTHSSYYTLLYEMPSNSKGKNFVSKICCYYQILCLHPVTVRQKLGWF